MKKVYLLSLLIVGSLTVIPIVAHGQAVVIKDTSCSVLDPSLTPFQVFDTVKVITPSKNLTKNVSCHGDLLDGVVPPPNAMVLDFDNTNGVKCCVNFDGNWFSTPDWHETITPSGNVSLTCHFKGEEPTDASCSGEGGGTAISQ